MVTIRRLKRQSTEPTKGCLYRKAIIIA